MRRILLAGAVAAGFATGGQAQMGAINTVIRPLAEDLAAQNEGVTFQIAYRALQQTYGALEFYYYHQISHMLIHEMGIPVLGWEEMAADTLTVASLVGDESDRNYNVLHSAILNWKINPPVSDDPSGDVFYRTHAFSGQRAYHVTCLLVGHNPERYAPIADLMQMPEQRRELCGDVSARALASWRAQLALHLRSSEDPEGAEIAITYNQPDAGLETTVAIMMRDTQFLEGAANVLKQDFAPPRALEFVGATCGGPGLYFAVDEGQLVICYELAASLVEAFAFYEMDLAEQAGKE